MRQDLIDRIRAAQATNDTGSLDLLKEYAANNSLFEIEALITEAKLEISQYQMRLSREMYEDRMAALNIKSADGKYDVVAIISKILEDSKFDKVQSIPEVSNFIKAADPKNEDVTKGLNVDEIKGFNAILAGKKPEVKMTKDDILASSKAAIGGARAILESDPEHFKRNPEEKNKLIDEVIAPAQITTTAVHKYDLKEEIEALRKAIEKVEHTVEGVVESLERSAKDLEGSVERSIEGATESVSKGILTMLNAQKEERRKQKNAGKGISLE